MPVTASKASLLLLCGNSKKADDDPETVTFYGACTHLITIGGSRSPIIVLGDDGPHHIATPYSRGGATLSPTSARAAGIGFFSISASYRFFPNQEFLALFGITRALRIRWSGECEAPGVVLRSPWRKHHVWSSRWRAQCRRHSRNSYCVSWADKKLFVSGVCHNDAWLGATLTFYDGGRNVPGSGPDPIYFMGDVQ